MVGQLLQTCVIRRQLLIYLCARTVCRGLSFASLSFTIILVQLVAVVFKFLLAWLVSQTGTIHERSVCDIFIQNCQVAST